MKQVYLIRHGKPDFPEGVSMCIGITDIPLGPEGLHQTEVLAQSLPPVAAVYSSPLSRCVQTAAALGKPVTLVGGLRELDAGDWDGLTFPEIRCRYPALYAARATDPTLLPPGAEPREAGLARFRAALETIAREAPGDCAVITHGGITALFLEHLTGTWRKPAYAEIIPLRWENGFWE